MAYELEIDDDHRRQGWKVKIRDNERVEPPHVSIIRGTRTWRFGLRDLRFLDVDPPAREVPAGLITLVRARIAILRAAWDRMYAGNPIGGKRAE